MNENTREVVLLLYPPLLEIVNTAVVVEVEETILVLRNHPFEAEEVEVVGVVVVMRVEVES